MEAGMPAKSPKARVGRNYEATPPILDQKIGFVFLDARWKRCAIPRYNILAPRTRL